MEYDALFSHLLPEMPLDLIYVSYRLSFDRVTMDIPVRTRLDPCSSITIVLLLTFNPCVICELSFTLLGAYAGIHPSSTSGNIPGVYD